MEPVSDAHTSENNLRALLIGLFSYDLLFCTSARLYIFPTLKSIFFFVKDVGLFTFTYTPNYFGFIFTFYLLLLRFTDFRGVI